MCVSVPSCGQLDNEFGTFDRREGDMSVMHRSGHYGLFLQLEWVLGERQGVNLSCFVSNETLGYAPAPARHSALLGSVLFYTRYQGFISKKNKSKRRYKPFQYKNGIDAN